MPSSVASAFLLFAIVLALASAGTAAIIVGALGLLFELVVFWRAGLAA